MEPALLAAALLVVDARVVLLGGLREVLDAVRSLRAVSFEKVAVGGHVDGGEMARNASVPGRDLVEDRMVCADHPAPHRRVDGAGSVHAGEQPRVRLQPYPAPTFS